LLSHYVNSIDYSDDRVGIRTEWGDLSGYDGHFNIAISPGVFQYTFDHTYPDDPTVCYWDSWIAPGISYVGWCTGGIYVCLGQDFSEIFTDATYFNCNPQTEPEFPNDGQRDIRFTYGTNNAAGDRIQDVLIDGSPVVFPYQGSVMTYDSIRTTGVPAPSGWESTLPISHIADLGTSLD